MAVAVSDHEAQDLRRLIPLNMLSGDRFEQLCSDVNIEDAPRGSVLFSKGDSKNEFVYVLRGTISLQADGMEIETITGGTEASRFALAHQIPRKVSAIAKDKVRFVRVDSIFVNQPNTQSDAGKANYVVREVHQDQENDWVTTLLSSPIFQRLSPASLQQLLRNLEEIPVTAGQQIIHQDDQGDYYYVIKQGRCSLSRKPSNGSREIKLAELKTCDTFGEDSLISDQPRNVTVTMLSDGSLLRLNKANFLKLVKEPIISYLDYSASTELVKNGARWLDVRSQDEFKQGHLPESVNIPFFMLRMELSNLARDRSYVLVCESGRVSEAAAFLLIRNSFDAFVMKGGLASIPDRNRRLTNVSAVPALSEVVETTVSQDLSDGDSGVVSELPRSISEFPGDSISLDASPLVGESDSGELGGFVRENANLRRQLTNAETENFRLKAEIEQLMEETDAFQPDLVDERIQAAEDAKNAAEQRTLALEAQIAELSSVVQEFVEQQSSEESDELQSIRSELATVRSQADADVASLQGRLKLSENEVARLRRELDGTYAQVLQLQSGVNVMPHDRSRSSGSTQKVVLVIVCLVAFLLGMVLTLMLIKSTDIGRTLIAQVDGKPTVADRMTINERRGGVAGPAPFFRS